jgi:hypothetical protein
LLYLSQSVCCTAAFWAFMRVEVSVKDGFELKP